MGWACQFSSVGLLLVGAGPPCQDVSTLNVDRTCSQVVRLLKKCFPRAQVHMFMESVASMDAEDRAAMSEDVGVIPCRVDAAGVSLARRLRLYWCTWELKDGDGFVMEAAALDGWAKVQQITLTAAGSEGFLGAPVVLASWPQAGYIHYTSRPSPVLELRCSAGDRTPMHRYTPYQYKPEFCAHHRHQEVASVVEREVVLGFPANYTQQCVPKAERVGPLLGCAQNTPGYSSRWASWSLSPFSRWSTG